MCRPSDFPPFDRSLGARGVSKSTKGRIIRHGIRVGSIPPGTSPVGKAAYVKGFIHGRRMRLAAYQR